MTEENFSLEEKDMENTVFFVLLISLVLIISWITRIIELIWWKPKRMEKFLREQGIRGPPYRLMFGNLKEFLAMMKEARSKPMNLSHKIVPRVSPFLHHTVTNYGKMSVSWFGTTPRVNILDPELIRDILFNKFGHYGKPKIIAALNLLITGLVTYEGEKWVKHRSIINPAFHLEKLKLMLPAFSTSCSELINRWENFIGPDRSFELDVWPEFQNFSGDVISRTAFGSNFEEGRRIFQLQTEQVELGIQAALAMHIPGFRFLPSKKNIRRKEIDKEVREMIRGIIEKKEKALKMGDAGNHDLLGLLIESNCKDLQEHENSMKNGMTVEEVIEECKLFYFAGQETTSILLTWTMVVLSMHPSWQVHARKEVLDVFGKNKPDIDGLHHLKIVTMILYEVLRLYPPIALLTRCTNKTMKLGEISFPPGVELAIETIFVHHDPEIWGEDADEFKPERFTNGVSNATKNQVAFFPFGWGPRICIGQNFAMIEAKMALVMVLQAFSFELSPSYAHAPFTVITLHPQYGAQIILHKL
eukprot:TRINITY_DN1742_c0_g1_i2.p1 TRINITY_DN1742_c0_g1~~TRINITY_DN1742_c0_g1_i2.p1  ORF type:complete len:530 (-),score=76.33 TRINITY_DN1742_c0_g1_i2:25-1614(-)